MPQRDVHPAELEDLDRCGMETMSCEEFARRADALREVIRERWVSEANVAAMQMQRLREANDRRASRLVAYFFLTCVAFAGLAWYLASIGQ